MSYDQDTTNETSQNPDVPKNKSKSSESSESINLMNIKDSNRDDDKNNLSTILHIEEEQTAQNRQIAYIGNNLTINKSNLYVNKKQKEAEGRRAILGSIFGMVLGIIAGLSTGFLAIFTVPIFATIGYLGGIYIADKVETGLKAGLKFLGDNNFRTKIKNFFTDRGERLDRTLGGIVGIIIGIALAATTGPAFLIALPFAIFFGNRIGTELGQNISPIIISGIRKVWKFYREAFQINHGQKINRIETGHDKYSTFKKLDDSEHQD